MEKTMEMAMILFDFSQFVPVEDIDDGDSFVFK